MRHFRSVSEPGSPVSKRRAFDETCETPKRATRHNVSPLATPDGLWRTPSLTMTAGPRPVRARALEASFEPPASRPISSARMPVPQRVATEPVMPTGKKALAPAANAKVAVSEDVINLPRTEKMAPSARAVPSTPQAKPLLQITQDSYRHPSTFVGEPVIFWAARLLVQRYAHEAASAPDVVRSDVILDSHQSEWRALAQQPIHHLLVWPDDAYERRGLWRPGQHSWAFHLNPGPLGRRLSDWFDVPHPESPDSDARDIEGIKLLFEHISPSMLMPWTAGFRQAIHADLWGVDHIASITDPRGPAISDSVVVGPPLALSAAPWINQLDPSLVKVTRAKGMSRGMPREIFERWAGAPPDILEALPEGLRQLLEGEPIALTDSVRRLIALCSLSNLPQETYGVAIGDPVVGYNAFELQPRGDHANLLDFIAASAPSLNEYFAIIIAEGVFIEVHADGMPRLGPTLKMIVQEMQTSLQRIVRLFASRDDTAGLAKIFKRLDDWCFAGQVREIEEILVELGESVLDADAVHLPVFHPADSDQDKAARLAGAYRNAQLRRFADTHNRPMTDPRLSDDPLFTASYFTPQTVRTFLAGQDDIRDRSDAGLAALIRYLSEDLVIFG